jgi:hypothetical protein
MSYENMGLCNGRRWERCLGSVMGERGEREAEKQWRRERENGRKE